MHVWVCMYLCACVYAGICVLDLLAATKVEAEVDSCNSAT